MENRNTLIDYVRGVAVILMIFGHNIQFGSGKLFFENRLFWYNKLFQFIYSFHMPLFALISGYLLYYSLKKILANLL